MVIDIPNDVALSPNGSDLCYDTEAHKYFEPLGFNGDILPVCFMELAKLGRLSAAAKYVDEQRDDYIDYLREMLQVIADIDLDEPCMGLRACVMHARGSLDADPDEVAHLPADRVQGHPQRSRE